MDRGGRHEGPVGIGGDCHQKGMKSPGASMGGVSRPFGLARIPVDHVSPEGLPLPNSIGVDWPKVSCAEIAAGATTTAKPTPS
jgi:hypothetical protein